MILRNKNTCKLVKGTLERNARIAQRPPRTRTRVADVPAAHQTRIFRVSYQSFISPAALRCQSTSTKTLIVESSRLNPQYPHTDIFSHVFFFNFSTRSFHQDRRGFRKLVKARISLAERSINFAIEIANPQNNN